MLSGSPTCIPLPPGLAPVWETPEDEDVFWRRDPMHSPGPITMLDADGIRSTYERGFNAEAERLGLPVRATSRRFWTRLYVSQGPPSLSPVELEAMSRHAEEEMPRPGRRRRREGHGHHPRPHAGRGRRHLRHRHDPERVAPTRGVGDGRYYRLRRLPNGAQIGDRTPAS